MNSTVKGAVKSITVWASAALVVAGQVAPYVNEATLVQLGLHGRSLQIALTASGLVMFFCRMITRQSLAEKGSPDPLPAPAPASLTTQDSAK